MRLQHLSILAIAMTAAIACAPTVYAAQEQPQSDNVQMLALYKEQNSGLKGLFRKMITTLREEPSAENEDSMPHPVLPSHNSDSHY